ncbi:MAG: hypothetical protein HQL39_17250 [Alphaproteobacteria bacterium]|nr:hypothetical protein [Alphaproteobacteria bacterium]
MPTPRSAGPAVSPPPFLAFVVGSNSEAITSRFAGFNPASNSVPKMDGSQILDLKPAERQDLVIVEQAAVEPWNSDGSETASLVLH